MSGYPNFDTYGFSWPGGPDYVEPPAPRCEQCGSFLRTTPDSSKQVEERLACDGVIRTAYEVRTGAIEDILGPGTDEVTWTECGLSAKHEAHSEVMGVDTITTTKCRRCGHENTSVFV